MHNKNNIFLSSNFFFKTKKISEKSIFIYIFTYLFDVLMEDGWALRFLFAFSLFWYAPLVEAYEVRYISHIDI